MPSFLFNALSERSPASVKNAPNAPTTAITAICGIEINAEQRKVLKYAAIRLEELDEPKEEECEFKDAGMYTPILKCDNCKSLYTILANDYLESNCELDQPTEWTYCPNCGQKIKKEKEENE